jgi:hypothetical protein
VQCGTCGTWPPGVGSLSGWLLRQAWRLLLKPLRHGAPSCQNCPEVAVLQSFRSHYHLHQRHNRGHSEQRCCHSRCHCSFEFYRSAQLHPRYPRHMECSLQLVTTAARHALCIDRLMQQQDTGLCWLKLERLYVCLLLSSCNFQ